MRAGGVQGVNFSNRSDPGESYSLFFSPGSYTDSQRAMSPMFDALEMVAQTRKGAELDVIELNVGTPNKGFSIM